MKYVTFVYLIVVGCYFLGCPVNGRRKKTVVTYNTGLYEQIDRLIDEDAPGRTVRRDAIIQQLKKTRADIVCLQEVYFGADVNAIVSELKPSFPHSFSALHGTSQTPDAFDTDPACPAAEFTPFGDCYLASCSAAANFGDIGQIALCMLTNCAAEFLALPQECWTCFVVAGPNITDILQSCTNAVPQPYQNINLPGLLLLSRRPLLDTGYTDLHPGTREVFEIGYLEAKVRKMGQIVCTQTTFNESDFYYELELQAAGINSWSDQSRLELSALANRFAHLERLFLLGDFYVGPGVPGWGILPYGPENYAILANAFSADPIRQCTICSSPENIYNDGIAPRIVDHIFFKGYKPLRKKRIYDDVTVQGFPLSFHFGVKQQFKCKRLRRH